MVHLCNMNMSAASKRHKSKGGHFHVDRFISELLASRKFDELAEKLAEKAANKIMYMDAAPFLVKRATDGNETNNITETTQEVNKKQSNREDVTTQLIDVELRQGFTGKIDPKAVVNATNSLSENLQLKYKYFRKNALEKKLKNNKDPLPKKDTKEDLTKQNKTIGPSGFKDHNNKTQEPISYQSATDKNQMEAEKESIDKNQMEAEKKSIEKNQMEVEKESIDKNQMEAEKESIDKNQMEAEKESIDKNEMEAEKESIDKNQMEAEKESIDENKRSHSGRPQDKAIVEQEVSHVDSGIREEKASGFEEDNQKHLTRSKENIIKNVEQNDGEPEKRVAEEINKNKNVIAQFRAHEDSFEKNKMTSENPNGTISRSHASDESDDRSPEERSPEDQSSKKQSAEDTNSSKPVIRKEGDKLYTYVKAPEYEEYHENLAKWQKEHPDNPADFM